MVTFFDKGGKDIQWKKDKLFNKWFWENWSTTCKRMTFLKKKLLSWIKTWMWQVLSSKYGQGAPKEIFSGKFTKLPEVSLFYCRLLLSPSFNFDLCPPPATPLPLSLSFSLFLPTYLLSCPVVHTFLGYISIPQWDSFGKPCQYWCLEAASMK